MNRRQFVQTASTAALMASALPAFPGIFKSLAANRMGVAAASYSIRRFSDPIEMMEHCHSLGFGGVQPGIKAWEKDYIKKVRKTAEKLGMFIEGQIRLPKEESDLERFEKTLTTAKEVGATICRVACGGRRYEDFDQKESFTAFKKRSIRSLQLAEPLLKKHQIKVAVENHKDWRISDLLEIMKLLDSEWVGITLDTGNSMSLLEQPMTVVDSFAPYAYSVHLKDMAVNEYEDGFLLSEVTLGEGVLDLNKVISTIQRHNPSIKFNLEMITRDPLKIPYLTDKYWATFDQIPGREVASFLSLVRKQKTDTLPYISDNTKERKIALEIENNNLCLEYGKQNLKFS
ncbi:MAG: sugar phosphate isomerase/epimerase [Cyclobacteriaceae bacterium]